MAGSPVRPVFWEIGSRERRENQGLCREGGARRLGLFDL